MSDIKQVGATTIEHLKHTTDAGALVITVGSLVEVLPALASLLSIAWMLIRIYETKTVQRLLGNVVAVDDASDD